MKVSIRLLTLILFFLGLITLWPGIKAKAQIDFFTFFIPYPTDVLDDQFDIGHAALDLINDDVESIISISVYQDNAVIYYDHWEDGLEATLTTPTQPTTQVWGDNDPTNGIPPDFMTDALQAGDVIILREVIDLPRNIAAVLPDGGDKLTAEGSPIAVTVSVWPLNEPSPPEPDVSILYAGAWELYPTNKWDRTYYIPLGQDLAGQRPGFTVVGLNVQAATDNTGVQLDLDANGSFEHTIVLNEGEQFTAIEGVNTGASIQATGPVQVHVLSANPASSYEARAYTITPFAHWTDKLLGPRSADGDFWLYNPHPTTLDVTVQTVRQTGVMTVPANSVARYPPGGLSGPTGVYFSTSDGRPFYGLAAFDKLDKQDWGHSLLPAEALTSQTLVGLGLGNNNQPSDGDESRVYVTALQDTTVLADYDNDGLPDASFPVSALEEAAITDPDHDLTGAFLYTEDETPFVTVWGQDESAPEELPSIDVGTSIVPFPSILVQKTVDPLVRDLDCNGVTSFGDIIQYKLKYFNTSVNAIDKVILEDDLPSTVTYRPGSTMLNGAPLPDAEGGTPYLFDEGGYNISSIPGRQSASVTFEVQITDPASPVSNRASIRAVTSPQKSDAALIFTPVLTAAETIYEIKAARADPAPGGVAPGEVITFNVTITNTARAAITSLALQDTFDGNHLTFQQAAPAPDTIASGRLSWNDLTETGGDVSPGGSIRLTIQFVVNDISADIAKTTTEVLGLGGEFSTGKKLSACSDTAEVFFKANQQTPTPAATAPPGETTTATPPPPDATMTPPPAGGPTITPSPSQTVVLTPRPSPSPTPTQTRTGNDDDDDDDGDDGGDCCDQPPAPSPGTPPPMPTEPGSAAVSPPPASTVLPVAFLPETGHQSAELSSARSRTAWPVEDLFYLTGFRIFKSILFLGGMCLFGWEIYRARRKA